MTKSKAGPKTRLNIEGGMAKGNPPLPRPHATAELRSA